FARAKYVAHDVYDHTSILKMVEARWNLASLGARDASARNLAEVLDFSQAPRSAPQYPAPPVVVGAACVDPVVGESSALRRASTSRGDGRANWRGLRTVASAAGWSVE